MTQNFTAWLLDGRETSEAPAIFDRDGDAAAAAVWSYRALAARTRRIAALVRAATPPGERLMVPILADSSAFQAAAYLGVLRAGAVAVPLAPMSDAALRSVLDETGARLAFADRGALDRVRALGAPRAVAVDEDELPPELRDEPAVDPRELALLLYTSGSTGRPRGVMVSTANLRANTEAILAAAPLSAADRALSTLPLFYCYGASVLHTHLRVGASVVLARADYPQDLLATLTATGATGLPAVPSTLQLLLARSSLASLRPPSLRWVMVSGGRLPEAMARELRAALPSATLHVRYGVTELTAAASFLPPERLDEKAGSIGRGLHGAPLRVLRDDGAPAAPGEAGEIVAASAHVTLGYFRDPAATAACYRDGAFHTGDLATVDEEGFVFIRGRERQFVKTAGHRVAVEEVEEVVAAAPGVAEAAAVGVPDPVRGEALAVLVVARPPHAPSPGELLRYCRAHLPPYKVPVALHVVPALPKTANGKLARRELPSLIPKPR